MKPSPVEMEHGVVDVAWPIARLQLKGLLELRHRVGVLSREVERDPEEIVKNMIGRIGVDRQPQLADGRFVMSVRSVKVAE